MASKSIRFSNFKERPTNTGLRQEYALEYSIVDTDSGEPEDPHSKTREVVIGISSTLKGIWGLDAENLQKVLFEFAKRHIKDKVWDNTLSAYEEIQLTSRNAPSQCPFDPMKIEMTLESDFVFPVTDQGLFERNTSSLAAQIIESRDNINVLFGERFKGKLLNLPQERNLLQLFRNCDTQEDFTYRAVSLCELAKSIETEHIKNLVQPPKGSGSLDTLGTFLRDGEHFPNQKTNKINQIMSSLQKLNHLRRGFPVHADSSEVIRALKFFGVEYPILDYQTAWIKLLKAYSETLQHLLNLLK
jgi:hypothetical protein